MILATLRMHAALSLPPPEFNDIITQNKLCATRGRSKEGNHIHSDHRVGGINGDRIEELAFDTRPRHTNFLRKLR